jgi:hypothetical protein
MREDWILEWLKSRDQIKINAEYIGSGSYKIHQKKFFFLIRIQDVDGQHKIFYIANKNTSWNFGGFLSKKFSDHTNKRPQSAIIRNLFELELYNRLPFEEQKKVFVEMKRIFPLLKRSAQIGSTYIIYKERRV